MNLAVVERVHRGRCVHAMGLPYVKCRLNPEKAELMTQSVDEVEGVITGYCLLLPYREGKNTFKQEYAVIYDDWDVGNKDFKKEKMSVSGTAFMVDVMDAEPTC